MKLVNDKHEQELVGIITEVDDVESTIRIVNSLNKDLMDSGFDQYQYQTVRQGNKIYVKRKDEAL